MFRRVAWFNAMTRAGLFALGVLASLCLGACNAQDAPGPSAASTEKNMAIPGGWSVQDPLDDDAQEAARFAVQTYAVAERSRVLYKDVIEAQRQVVSGMNFKLTLQVMHDARQRTARVTVWRQLNGSYQLTEWVWLD